MIFWVILTSYLVGAAVTLFVVSLGQAAGQADERAGYK